MKKIFTFLIVNLFCLGAYAGDNTVAVEAFFREFVGLYNSYDVAVTDHFAPNARITRTVIKPCGGREVVAISLSDYKQEIKKGRVGARAIGYKNNFSNIRTVKIDENTYRLTALRTPNRDKTGLPSWYVIIRQGSGVYKVQSENWDTRHQGFLKR
jgi:hypothetical protein